MIIHTICFFIPNTLCLSFILACFLMTIERLIKGIFFIVTMATRIGGARRKTRAKFTKNVRQKGKLSLTRYFQEFNNEDRVVLKAEPSIQKGMYYRRFHGLSGLVKGMQGDCYKIRIVDGNKPKTMIVHPIHLKKLIS